MFIRNTKYISQPWLVKGFGIYEWDYQICLADKRMRIYNTMERLDFLGNKFQGQNLLDNMGKQKYFPLNFCKMLVVCSRKIDALNFCI